VLQAAHASHANLLFGKAIAERATTSVEHEHSNAYLGKLATICKHRLRQRAPKYIKGININEA
jgi:hypothetical protein